jgi:PDZ domain-containing protein
VPLGEEPGCADDDERIGIIQREGDSAGQRGAGASAAGTQCNLDGTAPRRRRAGRQRALDVGRLQLVQAGQRSERRCLHARIGVGESTAGQGGATAVPGHGDAAAPDFGAAVTALIRGNIVAHLPSMSEPDATADGEAAANPTSSEAGPEAGVASDADGAPLSAPAAPARRRRIWFSVLAGLVVIVVVAALVAARTSVNYYVLTPGDATPVAQYIDVPAADAHPLTGKILLTDVYVTQLNALNYLRYRFFDSDSEVITGADLLGPTTDENQYLDQGYLEMTQAQSFATAAALSHLGYSVTSTNAGALIFGIAANSPAAATLQVAQVITAVNTTPVTSDCSLIAALHGLSPGQRVVLKVEDSSINKVGDFVYGPIVTKSVKLGTPPKGLVDTGCGAATPPTAYLGIEPQTQQDWHFPVKVTVHTQNIGGPSAGLAMTLGIIDKLSSGRLTGNRIVAATGTIDQHGNVGDVGGVAEKTIAVERAGATVFFVPNVELKAAESKATPQLHVYAVNNLGQVLRILQRLGGKAPTKPVPVQAAP